MGASIKKIIKGALFFSAFVSILSACTGYKPAYLQMKNEDGTKIFESRSEFLKEYALCSCLSQFGMEDSLRPKGASIGAYYNLSDDELMILDIGKRIDSNAKGFIEKRKNISGSTFENRKTPVLDCITYSKSKELNSFIQGLITELKNHYRKK